jgi:hypothetical protein
MTLPVSTRAEYPEGSSACALSLALATRTHVQIVDKTGFPPLREDHGLVLGGGGRTSVLPKGTA